jgi:TonB-linked SusC/RagA family outer membrane protein
MSMKRTFRTFLSSAAAALFALAAVVPAAAQAQTGTLVGKVTDAASGAPLAGATVLIGGTTLLGVTNDAGEYSIANIRPGLLAVSVQRIGYQATGDTVRLAAGARATRDFRLTQTLSRLSDVVVTGVTGNTQRKAQAAVVASVPAADIVRNSPVSSVNELLQSRLPGVSVNAASGSVGTSRSIRIRGASSISLSNQPLIFIDGIRVSEAQNSMGVGGQATDRLNDINPDDIESIEVVKGPAAATLYGADASAGVIQIITKKGKLGSNTFEQNLRFDYAQIDQNWTPPSNFGNCSAAAVAATSVNPLCRGQAVGTLVSDNPLERVGAFQTGGERNFGWTGRGGGSNYGYFLSATSDKSEGTLPNNAFERIGFRSNVNFVPSDKVKVDIGLNILQSDTQLPDNDNNIYGWLGGALLGSPTTRRDDGGDGQDGWFGFNRQFNAIKAIQNTIQSRRTQANVAVSFQPTSWFTNRLNVGGDLARDEFTKFFPLNARQEYAGNLNTGDNTQTRVGFDRFTIDYLGTMKGSFGADDQWGVNLSGGLQSIITRQDVTDANGFGFVTNAANSVNNASTRTGGQSFSETKALGYLGELQLSHQDKRFLQLGARLDQNSSFGEGAPTFFLPRVGVSWVLSEEEFLAPILRPFSQFRVRAAYGTTGRAPTPGASLTTFSAAPFAITGTQAAGAIPLNPGNDSLRAERGTEFEAGLDASLWDDRINIEFTYFNKVTKDLLLTRPLPPSLGFLANPFANIGEVRNSGLELVLTTNLVRTANFDWTSTLGGNTLDNELVSLGGVNPFGTTFRFTEGFPLASLVSKRIRSVNEATGVVTVADTLEAIGGILPTLEWNWSNSITVFKNFRVTALLDSKSGHYIFNNTAFFRETQLVRDQKRLDPNFLTRAERLRRYGNDAAGQPAFVQENGRPTTVNEVRDAFMESADFIRLRELAVGYTLPSGLLSRLGNRIKGGTITFAAQNLALWTDYSGGDPEVVSSGAANFDRTDFLTLPNPRRFVIKTNFTF